MCDRRCVGLGERTITGDCRPPRISGQAGRGPRTGQSMGLRPAQARGEPKPRRNRGQPSAHCDADAVRVKCVAPADGSACGSKPASVGAARTTPSSGRQHQREPDEWSTRGAGEIRAANLRSYPTSPTMQTLVCPLEVVSARPAREWCTGRTLVEVDAPCLCTRLLGRARSEGAPRLVLATDTGATHSPIARMDRLQALDLAVNRRARSRLRTAVNQVVLSSDGHRFLPAAPGADAAEDEDGAVIRRVFVPSMPAACTTGDVADVPWRQAHCIPL